jgi:NTP pyrophosphatase (non-canonical NTP hydrolase)
MITVDGIDYCDVCRFYVGGFGCTDGNCRMSAPMGVQPSIRLTIAEFSTANRERCVKGFGRVLDASAIQSMSLGLAEEAGEVSGALRRMLGFSKTKTPVTAREVADEIADLVTYADLTLACLGESLEAALARKFNIVSARIGWPRKLPGGGP